MVVYTRNFIGGRRVEPLGGGFCEVRSPFNGEWVGVAPQAGIADVDLAVRAARQAIETGIWSGQPLRRRVDVVERFMSTYVDRMPCLSALITRETGIPVRHNTILGDDFIARVALMVEGARSSASRAEMTSAGATVTPRPAGVTLAMPAWNAPQSMAIGWLVAAILAGCAVILALPSRAPLDGQVIGELMMEAGLPEGLLSILVTRAETADYLAGNPGVDRLAVSSWNPDSQRLASIAASQMKPLTLESGRGSAALLLPDIDIAAAIAYPGDTCLFANGQWPTRQDRFLVPRHRQAELVAALRHAFGLLQLGDPLAPSTDIGPLVSHAQRDTAMRAVERAVAEGAELAAGGGAIDQAGAIGAFLQPTILANAPRSANQRRDVIAGPVALVIPYDDVEQAIMMLNEGGHGAAASVWTSDTDLARTIAQRLRARVVAINSSNEPQDIPTFRHRRTMGPLEGFRGMDEFLDVQTLIT